MTDPTRRNRGSMAYHAGASAEHCVARDYERRGHTVAAQRWRGDGGEIDLVVHDGDGLIFVEVKHARSFDGAVERITARQIDRICATAAEFLATQPRGSLTPVRFDVALMNGRGEMRMIENAFGHG